MLFSYILTNRIAMIIQQLNQLLAVVYLLFIDQTRQITQDTARLYVSMRSIVYHHGAAVHIINGLPLYIIKPQEIHAIA